MAPIPEDASPGSALTVSAALLAAFLLSALMCALVRRLGVRDAPDGVRKLQTQAVPTSGGLGVAAAFVLVLGLPAAAGWRGLSEAGLATIAASLGALTLGAWDDRFDLRARLKLVAMLGLALALTAAGVRAETLAPWPGLTLALPAALGAAGSILWLVVMMNAVNMMDGANGLAMGMALIASAGLGLAAFSVGEAEIALTAAVLAAALAGFLVWNVSGRLFAGDAGALFVGMLLGGLSLQLVQARPDLVWIPPLLLLPFLTDVLATLAWRSRRGKALFEGHRDHVYQIALKARLKHWQVALIHAVWSANAAAVAVVAAIAGGRAPALVFLAFLAISVWINARARRSGERAGLVGAGVD